MCAFRCAEAMPAGAGRSGGLRGGRGLGRLTQLRLPPPHTVNAARGAIVDRAAMVHALDSGRLRGAGLDVHWSEPCSPGDPLLLRPGVIGTPHMAASTQQFFDNVANLLAENLAAVLQDDPGRLRHRIA